MGIVAPPVEGKPVAGRREREVGPQPRVRLVLADVERGFIDFGPAG
jgi:hypothetical protein